MGTEQVPERSSNQLMLELISYRDSINTLAASILPGNMLVFPPLNIKVPSLNQAELGFLRLVAWLYAHYVETGRAHLQFVMELLPGFGIDPGESAGQHYELVNGLRTYCQHVLNCNRDHDAEIVNRCQTWFRKVCGTAVPIDDSPHWSSALKALLEEARVFLQVIFQCMQAIEASRDENLTAQWHFRVTHYRAPAEYDELISQVAGDMGRSLNAVSLRNRYFQRWNNYLASLQHSFDFNDEARRLIEYAILSEPALTLPISGKDIMDHFSIEPGPEVGRLLSRAKTIYAAAPCDCVALLAALQEEMESGT